MFDRCHGTAAAGTLAKINVIKKSNRYSCKIENFAFGQINERVFSNSPPSSESNEWHH